MFDFSNLKKLDNTLLVSMVLLCIIGGANVFATTYFPDKTASKFFYNQILFYVVGFVLFLLFSTFDYSKLKNKYIVIGIFVTTLISLIAVLFFGDYAFEAKRWIVVGPFTIQPSEFSKLSIILITAFCFTQANFQRFERIKNIYKLKDKNLWEKLAVITMNKHFVKLTFSFLSLVVIVLLIIQQKSLGNSVIILLIYSSLIYFATDFSLKTFVYILITLLTFSLSFNVFQIQKPEFFVLFGLAIILFIVYLVRKFELKKLIVLLILIIMLTSYFVLNLVYNNVLLPYQRNRIETFLNPDSNEALSDNYNKEQAILAVGSGGIVGRGFLNGNVTNLGLLPFAFTDFAFAAYAEQFGFIGNLFLFSLFFFLIFKILSIARNTNNRFGMLICSGVAIMICLNTFQHIGMNMGLLPITGVPLPFISYGGSAVLTVFIGMGLVSSVQIKAETEEEDVVNIKNEMIN